MILFQAFPTPRCGHCRRLVNKMCIVSVNVYRSASCWWFQDVVTSFSSLFDQCHLFVYVLKVIRYVLMIFVWYPGVIIMIIASLAVLYIIWYPCSPFTLVWSVIVCVSMRSKVVKFSFSCFYLFAHGLYLHQFCSSSVDYVVWCYMIIINLMPNSL